jgi:hypothetical protein|tara:strand:- start:404 stop:973 length:570 start_codon:yes stop_codon:yes gene_type:complete
MGQWLTPKDLNSYSEIVSEYVDDPNEFKIFVETGTAYGQTLQQIQPYFEKIFTVEISQKLWEWLHPQIRQFENVEHVLGDSLVEIPKFLKTLDENDKVFFWLDAHWSQGLSDKNHLDVPLIEECVIIDEQYKSDTAIVAIDDVRMFETNINEDWSSITIDAVKSSFKNFDILVSKEIEDRLILFISRKK